MTSRPRKRDSGDTAATRRYHVYVIEVVPGGARTRDPGRGLKPTLYVGQSGKTPEARLRDHRLACKRYCPSCACRHYAGGRRGGGTMRLRWDLFQGYAPPRTRRQAEGFERLLARRLRKRGYHVIGGH